MGVSIISQIVILFILAAYTYILCKSRLNARVVKYSAAVILIAGTFTYMYGYRLEGYVEGFASLFLRSLIGSIKLFLTDSVIFESLKAQQQPLFLDIYITIYYAAMITSFSAIIMLFGKRVTTFISLAFRRKKFDHIFIGMNERSIMIAKEIPDKEIAFIEFPGDEKDEDSSIKTLLRPKDKKNNDRLLSSGNITVLRARSRLSQEDSDRNVFSRIGLNMLRQHIDAHTAFYLLSEDGERNLQELLIIVSDNEYINNTVHACVKREGLTQSYHGVLGKTGAHMIYPSSLSIVELMKSTDCHPSDLMTINHDSNGKADGTVQGEFNALVIGFGETGQAATKFIYEFSSAILKDRTQMPVHIYITDNNLERLKGEFMFSCPDLEHDNKIIYENYGLDSGQFWSTLLERLDSLNYIVISMKNDTVNLDIACTIYEYAQKKRKNGLNNFRIFVRKRHTPAYEARLVRRINERCGCEVIRCFGEYDKIFTPEMIISKSSLGINTSATDIAGEVHRQYASISGIEENQTYSSDSFHEKRLRRREMHQHISRANHIPTKLKFIGGNLDISEETLENMAICEHLRYKNYLLAHGYSYDTEDDDILKMNHQICSWDGLSEDDRRYHRDMVKASLAAAEKIQN